MFTPPFAVRLLGPCAALALAASASAQIRLQGIDVLAGFEASEATGISADGTAVIAFCDGPDLVPGTPNARVGAVWTQANWITSIGTLGGNYSEPVAVSADGSVVTGAAHTDPFGGDEHAFRWTRSGGIQDLGVPFGGDASFGTGISANGNVICGYVVADGGTSIIAFQWTLANGMQQISTSGEAVAMSADGSVIIGHGGPAGYRWTAVTGAQPLPAPPAEWESAEPVAISADGSMIVGTAVDAVDPTITAVYSWTAGGGYQFLPHRDPMTPASEAAGVAPDGSIIFGFSAGEPAVWSNGGVQGTEEFLESHDIFIGGWTELEIRGIAADGRTIAGTGANPPIFTEEGEPEGWIVTLPVGCYANCDGNATPPMLNVNDFVCFMQKFAAGDPYANCDESVAPPMLSVNDFICFLGKFAAGCP
jgi:probable HAF family extracellular repeat protein